MSHSFSFSARRIYNWWLSIIQVDSAFFFLFSEFEVLPSLLNYFWMCILCLFQGLIFQFSHQRHWDPFLDFCTICALSYFTKLLWLFRALTISYERVLFLFRFMALVTEGSPCRKKELNWRLSLPEKGTESKAHSLPEKGTFKASPSPDQRDCVFHILRVRRKLCQNF